MNIVDLLKLSTIILYSYELTNFAILVDGYVQHILGHDDHMLHRIIFLKYGQPSTDTTYTLRTHRDCIVAPLHGRHVICPNSTCL